LSSFATKGAGSVDPVEAAFEGVATTLDTSETHGVDAGAALAADGAVLDELLEADVAVVDELD
jgi:hypothetical protein